MEISLFSFGDKLAAATPAKYKRKGSTKMAERAKKKVWQKLLIALGIAAIVIVVFFGAVIGYFRISVSEYYKASEKAFEIPGISDGFVAQGISYDAREDTFFLSGYMNDKRDRKSTRLNSSHTRPSRMPSSA